MGRLDGRKVGKKGRKERQEKRQEKRQEGWTEGRKEDKVKVGWKNLRPLVQELGSLLVVPSKKWSSKKY
jgi:hypothetical protein